MATDDDRKLITAARDALHLKQTPATSRHPFGARLSPMS
jgi:hypothetical protein